MSETSFKDCIGKDTKMACDVGRKQNLFIEQGTKMELK